MNSTITERASRRQSIAFLNVAHAIDHFVLLIYPTVVIGLNSVYHRSYSEMIALSTATFVAFGMFSLPAGWLADRWSRRNMIALFYGGCGVSLAGAAFAPNLATLAVALFAIGMFASIYHPVGMAMLIEASQASGRTLAFNGLCGNFGVSLAPGISALFATWLGWRAAFLVPAVVCTAVAIAYLCMTTDDSRYAKSRKSEPAVSLTGRHAVIVLGVFTVMILTGSTTFHLLTIALPKIADERLAQHVPLLLAGSATTVVLVCGGLAQLCVGRLVGRFSPHIVFVAITFIGFLGNLWAVYADGIMLMVALTVAVGANYGQVTLNDLVLARYTADAWRGRIYAARYFLVFISAATAIGMISLLHERSGFYHVLAVNAGIAFAMFAATTILAAMTSTIEDQAMPHTRTS
jgi:MFS family permease